MTLLQLLYVITCVAHLKACGFIIVRVYLVPNPLSWVLKMERKKLV